MAGDTLMQLSWNGGYLEEIVPIATGYLSNLNKKSESLADRDKEDLLEAIWFFEDIVSGKSYFGGNKGDLWLCGRVTKFPELDIFLRETLPFFKELWKKDIILDFRPVILFFERGDESAGMYIIRYDEEKQDVMVDGPYRSEKLCWET